MLTRCPLARPASGYPEQLKLRAGKVRCGSARLSLTRSTVCWITGPRHRGRANQSAAPQPAASAALVDTIDLAPIEDIGAVPARDRMPDADSSNEPISPEAVRDAALTHGLIAARETTEIPGCNKWAEGALSAPVQVSIPVAPPNGRSCWPHCCCLPRLPVRSRTSSAPNLPSQPRPAPAARILRAQFSNATSPCRAMSSWSASKHPIYSPIRPAVALVLAATLKTAPLMRKPGPA